MRGKKARGRSNRNERGAAAAQRSPAVPSASHDPPGPDTSTQQPANSQETTAAPTCGSEQATRAQLTETLGVSAKSTLVDIEHANDQLVVDRFLGSAAHEPRSRARDVAAIAAAAERGDAQAQLHMLRSSYESGTLAAFTKQRSRALEQNNSDTILWMGLRHALQYLANEKDDHQRDVVKDAALNYLPVPAARGLATAQYTLGMLIYCIHCDSSAKADVLNAARWIRKAAMQGFMDAQYELGEMFRHGVFCDHIYMRFARKYIRRASVQGHVEAITRMHELRTCVQCGADDAPRACSLCHQARYCNTGCSEKHWCEGNGVGGGISGNAGARHKDTCPRMYARKSRADKGLS